MNPFVELEHLMRNALMHPPPTLKSLTFPASQKHLYSLFWSLPPLKVIILLGSIIIGEVFLFITFL